MAIDLGNEIERWLVSDKARELLVNIFRVAIRTELQELLDGELIDVRQAAELLSMSEGAVRKAAERGRLPRVKIGKRLRFRRAELLTVISDDNKR